MLNNMLSYIHEAKVQLKVERRFHMEMTTENEKMKDLTPEQQQLVNEIMERESQQAKVNKIVEEELAKL